jgi:hypothetical protein
LIKIIEKNAEEIEKIKRKNKVNFLFDHILNQYSLEGHDENIEIA